MATRLYLPSVGISYLAGANLPAFDAGWEGTTGAVRRRLVREKEGTAYTTVTTTKNTATNPADILIAQFVSPPLRAQTIANTGFIKGVIQAICSSAALADAQLTAKVFDQFGTTLRGTLVSMQAAAQSNEFNTTQQNRKFPLAWTGSGAALTQVVAQQGDVIVIEVGGRMFTAATGGTVSLRLGDSLTDADLAENETDTADGVPWFEFSQDLLFDYTEIDIEPPPLELITPLPGLFIGANDGLDYGSASPQTRAYQGGDLPPGGGAVTYYKMQAPCSSAPSGYISWVNTTGDDTDRPACGGVLGDTVEIARWSGE